MLCVYMFGLGGTRSGCRLPIHTAVLSTSNPLGVGVHRDGRASEHEKADHSPPLLRWTRKRKSMKINKTAPSNLHIARLWEFDAREIWCRLKR